MTSTQPFMTSTRHQRIIQTSTFRIRYAIPYSTICIWMFDSVQRVPYVVAYFIWKRYRNQNQQQKESKNKEKKKPQNKFESTIKNPQNQENGYHTNKNWGGGVVA